MVGGTDSLRRRAEGAAVGYVGQMRWLLLLLAGCTRTGSTPSPGADSAEDTTNPDVLRAPIQFRFPLVEPELFQTVVGVDHDPTVQNAGIDQLICTDYLGRSFPHCYDEHRGTDYILHGGFEAMDAGSTPIVAAADGVVVEAEDGHYDRCHGDMATGTNDCDGHEMVANHVILRHEVQGLTFFTWYWHMKEGSVAVEVDEQVSAGDPLGLVGSSGNSYTPHLHFELHDGDDEVIDPYAGPESQPETYWCEQGDPDGLPGLCD